MTFSEEYIKMVLALPEEFFENWEWKEGDCFIRKPPGETDFIDIQFIGNRTYWDYTNTIYYICNEGDVVDGEVRPLPSQEQLQTILFSQLPLVHTGYEDLSPFQLVVVFFWLWVNWDKPSRGKFPLKFNDFHEAWLSFLMEEIYSKKWNGEEWV